MTQAFDSIRQGLNEAISHAKSQKINEQTASVKLYQPHAVDVSGLRQRLNFTQEQFAARLGSEVQWNGKPG